jgi:hypothetical protein
MKPPVHDTGMPVAEIGKRGKACWFSSMIPLIYSEECPNI